MFLSWPTLLLRFYAERFEPGPEVRNYLGGRTDGR